MSLRNIILTGFLACFTLAISVSCGKKDGSVSTDTVEFSLPDLSGASRTLKDYRNDLIIIDFWATWCPPCRESIPHLNKTFARHKERVSIVGISLDKSGTKAEKGKVSAFSESMQITYPVLFGDIPLARRYGVSSIPTLLFTDREGRIIKRHSGFLDAASLNTLIQGLLAQTEADNA